MTDYSTRVPNLSAKIFFLAKKNLHEEAELLFLLNSLKHPNIVELVASYVHCGITSLLFYPADLDLHQFLLQPERSSQFEADFVFFQALHGLSSGLAYLHNFHPRPCKAYSPSTVSMHGYHHDIKPRNVLVRGTTFILADFGFSKLKQDFEDTKTRWKDTTFEYGSPECRSPGSWSSGLVGRALDIWSLGCITSEVLTYVLRGLEGISEFRRVRIIEHSYGKMSCFHDGEALSLEVVRFMERLEEQSNSESKTNLFAIIRKMLVGKSDMRCDAMEVEASLSHVTVEALVDAVQIGLRKQITNLDNIPDRNLVETRIQLENNRLAAWSRALGLKSRGSAFTPCDEQVRRLFQENCQTLNSALDMLNSDSNFDEVEDRHDFILAQLHNMNNNLCKRLSPESRTSVDNTFRIMMTSTSNMEILQQIGTLNIGSAPNHEVCTVASLKYMSLLIQEHAQTSFTSNTIESSLIREDSTSVDLATHPQTYWYSYGYQTAEERKVVIEYMPYWKRKHDVSSKDFAQAVSAMFERVQELVAMLKQTPKPSNFRVLDCLGTFHDRDDLRFGLVYEFPSQNSEPVRLNTLLRHHRTREIMYPDLGQKLALARALAASLQSFHLSGWIHKQVSSLNVLFFPKTNSLWKDLDLEEPFIVGFDHSRKAGNLEYSQGAILTRISQEYLHPDYRNNARASKPSDDYYSLGLVLLEIGTWTSISNIYRRHPTHAPDELKKEYIQYCDEHLGRAMGAIYQKATRRCLEWETFAADMELEEELVFQTDVVDRLNKCLF